MVIDDVQEPLSPAHLRTGYHLLRLPDPHSLLEQEAYLGIIPGSLHGWSTHDTFLDTSRSAKGVST